MKANEAAKLYANTHTEWFDSEGNPNVVPAFEAGAKWADKTMIEKACEWLQNHTMKELCMKEEDSGLVQEFIESFKQAMEE